MAIIAGSFTASADTSSGAGSHRAWLGVSTQSLDGQLREGLDYRGNGVLVNQVAEGSPAERAGLRQGDVIVGLNGANIDSPEQLQTRVHEAGVGDRVRLEISREGRRQSLAVTLGERPDDLGNGEGRRRVLMRTDREDRESPEARETPDAPEPPEMDETPETPEPPEAPEAPEVGEGMDHLKMLGDLKGLGALGDLPFAGRGRLGVQLQDLNPDLGSYFSAPGGRGALIVLVEKDSPAARAGLKAGDVIVRVGDQATNDADETARAIRAQEGRISITVLRRGQRQSVEAELAPRAHVQRIVRGHGAMNLDDLPSVGDRHREESEVHRELQELREEIRQLREELRQKSPN
jgi:membrane-associated protease RseP (regulator of RpoE activity)